MSADNIAAIIAVAIVPLVVLMLSAFVKVSVVLALLRNAIGAPQAPPNLVVTGLALLITAFVMAPVGQQVLDAVAAPTSPAPRGPGPTGPAPRAPGPTTPAPAPATDDLGPTGVPPRRPSASGAASAPASAADAGTATGTDAVAGTRAAPGPARTDLPRLPDGPAAWLAAADRAQVPIRAFLARHAHAEDRATFTALARDLRGHEVADDDLLVLAAAFVTSELTEAFAIAFLVFLPFLVLDLVVGIGLGALGLTSTPPSTVSLPLKLVLFVAVDGWRLLVDGLARGYT